jgi:hypothetical protein
MGAGTGARGAAALGLLDEKRPMVKVVVQDDKWGGRAELPRNA